MEKILQKLKDRLDENNILIIFHNKIIIDISVKDSILYFSNCRASIIKLGDKRVSVTFIYGKSSATPILYNYIENFLNNISIWKRDIL